MYKVIIIFDIYCYWDNDLMLLYIKLRDWHFPPSVYTSAALGRNPADRHLRIIRLLSLFP